LGIAARRSRLALGILRLSLLLIVLFRPVCGVGRLHMGEHLLLSRLAICAALKVLRGRCLTEPAAQPSGRPAGDRPSRLL